MYRITCIETDPNSFPFFSSLFWLSTFFVEKKVKWCRFVNRLQRFSIQRERERERESFIDSFVVVKKVRGSRGVDFYGFFGGNYYIPDLFLRKFSFHFFLQIREKRRRCACVKFYRIRSVTKINRELSGKLERRNRKEILFLSPLSK